MMVTAWDDASHERLGVTDFWGAPLMDPDTENIMIEGIQLVGEHSSVEHQQRACKAASTRSVC